MAASVVSTITKTLAMPGTNPVNSTYTPTGQQPIGLEDTVTHNSPVTVNDGIGVIVAANLQIIYLLSDHLDCTVTFYDTTAGAGSAVATFTLVAGVAQQWDTNSGASPFSDDALSVVIDPAQTVGGVASDLTTTDIHIRVQLTA